MSDDLEKLVEGEGFTDAERQEILAPEPSEQPAPPPDDPTPVPEETPPPEPPAKPDFVQRIDKEKARRKAVEAELAELKAKWEESQRPKEPAAPEIPDPNVDPWGHVAARMGMTEETLKRVTEMVTQQRQAAEADRQQQEFMRGWQRELSAFQKTRPDVGDAIAALKESRVKELEFLGATPDQIEATLASEEAGLVQNARRLGRNPAEYLYELATLRRAYSPKPTVTTDIERIAAGQKSASSSINSGAADHPGAFKLDSVLDISSDKYEKLLADKFDGSLEKLLDALKQ